MEYAARQPNDGYSFVIGNIGPAAVNPLMTKVPYDVERDFVAISLIATGPNVLIVNPGVPAKSFRELIDLAKSNSGKLNYGTSGPGSVSQLAGEMLKILAGVAAAEIPYKGGILAVQDVVAGHLQFIFADSLPSMQFIKAEKVRALCVTSPERSPLVPDLPPCAETLPGLVAISWWGVFMPTGVPKAIIDQFHVDLVKALQDPDVKRKFADLGVDAVHDTPEEFVAFIKSETAKYSKLIKDAESRGIEGAHREARLAPLPLGGAAGPPWPRAPRTRRRCPACRVPSPWRRCRSARSPRRAGWGSRARARSRR